MTSPSPICFRMLAHEYCCLWSGQLRSCNFRLPWLQIVLYFVSLEFWDYLCSLLIYQCRPRTYLSQRTSKSRRLVRPAKTQISLRIRAVWSVSSLIACAFYSLRAIQRGLNKNPCYTRWMYRLVWVFAGHTGLIVGFVMRWLKLFSILSYIRSQGEVSI